MKRELSMRRWLGWVLVGVLAWGQGVQAQPMPQPPGIEAKAFLLMDVTANQVLAEFNADQPVEPASLTKLMTAYLVFDALKLKKIRLDQKVPVSVRAWKMPGSRMFIDPKMEVPVEDLIKGMIVQSGNDATVLLAEAVGGSVERFVELMNQQAKVLGMNQTGYRNPEGLTAPGHQTTARDLATLATRLVRDFPEEKAYYAIKKYRYPGTPAANDTNRNLLLFKDPTVDGLKTGHTEAAGYCLIATAHRPMASGQERRLMVVVLGARSELARAQEAQKLLNWGYATFEGVRIFEANKPVVSAKVWKGKADQVGLGSDRDIVVAVPQGQASQIKTEAAHRSPLMAPLNAGDVLGELKVTLGGKPLRTVPLTALDGVDSAGLLGRAWDALRLWIR
jgi:D-alanyl-D-alanine carboxypeptidase (penicillin-binding protein 5/6)